MWVGWVKYDAISFPGSHRVREAAHLEYPTLTSPSKQALWINQRLHFSFACPCPTPNGAKRVTSCCQVGGVGDRHTTFLGLDAHWNHSRAPRLGKNNSS